MSDRWSNPSRPWRRWYVVLPAAVVVLGAVALSDDAEPGSRATSPSTPALTATSVPPTVDSTSSTSTAPPPTAPARDCDPSYPDVCLDPSAVDYDCAGGSGDGPRYVEGPLEVRPPNPFDLDREGDGVGCEAG